MRQFTGFVTFLLVLHLGILVEGEVSASVNCSDGFDMQIIISGVNDTAQWTTPEWQLNNVQQTSCEPTFNASAETVTYNFDGKTCNGSFTNTSEFFGFQFVINASKTGDTPVLAYDHHYIISCYYRRNGTAYSRFTPIHVLSDTTTDTVNLNVSLTLTQGSFGGNLFGDSVIPLAETIYAELIIVEPFLSELDLSLNHCFLSKDPAGNDGTYTLVNDSCENPSNRASPDYNCSLYTNETERFTFVAVRYPGQNDGDKVYVHCDFYVCFADNYTSFCRERCDDCTNKRKRRDVGDTYEPDDTIHHVTAGPYTFRDRDGQQSSDDGGKAKPTPTTKTKPDERGVSENSIIALAVSGVVAIAIVCVTVFVLLYKHSAKLPASEMAMENPACKAGETI